MTKPRSIDSIRIALGAGALLFGLAACGSSAPTRQLSYARSAYQMAAASETTQMAPQKLRDARQALDEAEKAHKQDPGSTKEANLAYVAQRKAEIAIMSGKTLQALQKEQQLNSEYQAALEAKTQGQQAQLSHQQAMQQQQQAQQATEEEKQQAAQALANLGEVASVKQEANGTVLTLSGAVLFPTGGDTLSDDAHDRLDKVAQALSQQPRETEIRVEGYTDSTGAAQANEALSQRRADAVRSYLSQRGVPSTMLESIGRGESNPIASNATQNGRAINRRAEIVVKLPEGETLPGGMAPKGQRPSSSAKTPPGELPQPQPKERQYQAPQPQPNQQQQPYQQPQQPYQPPQPQPKQEQYQSP